MKKQLLALAVSAAVLPGVAAAEGPTVYGKLNVAVERQSGQDDNGVAYTSPGVPAGASARTSTWEVESYKSRLGVKGDVELDVGGLEGFYKAEFEIFADDGVDNNGNNNAFKQRDIYAGLRGSFGSVQVGKFNSPFKKSEGNVDQFSDYATDFEIATVGQDRFSNSIQYSSPALADAVTVNVALIPNENQNDFDLPADGQNENSLDDTVSTSVVFSQGGLYGALAMNMNQDEDLIVDDLNSGSTVDSQRIVVGFESDAFEAGALYQISEENDANPAIQKGEDTTMLISGAFNMDRIKLKAQHQMVEGDKTKNEVTVSTVGADYALGKMSMVYAYYGMVDVDYDAAATADEEYSVLSFGLEHKF